MILGFVDMAKIDDIKRRIRALNERTVENGCTLEEANTAMRMIGKLLAEYQLELTEVFINDEAMTFDTTMVSARAKRSNRVNTGVAIKVAELCGTKVYQSKYNGELYIVFFGSDAKRQVSEYLYNVILDAYESECERFRNTLEYLTVTEVDMLLYEGRATGIQGIRRMRMTDFSSAFRDRINNRINTMILENTPKQTTTGTDLIVLERQVLEQNYEDHKKNLNMKRNNQKLRVFVDQNSYDQGTKAANRVNLNPALNSNGKNQETLLIG